MEPLFTKTAQGEPVDVESMVHGMRQMVRESIERMNKDNQTLAQSKFEMKEGPPACFSPTERMLFWKREFLDVEYKNFMITKSSCVIEVTESLYADVASLCRLIQVFPFLKRRIAFDEKTGKTILRMLEKNGSPSITANEASSIFFAAVLHRLQAEINKIPREPAAIEMPLPKRSDEAQMRFDTCLQELHYDAVRVMIEEFSPDHFADQLEAAALTLIRRLSVQKAQYADFTLFLVDFVFARVDLSFAKLDQPYGGIAVLKERKVRDFVLPACFADPDTLDLSVTEFVEKNPSLDAAAGELTLTMFEWSPTNVLMRVQRALEHLQTFIINRMKANGENAPGFVPFDDTFSLFIVAVAGSNIENLESVMKFACDLVDERQLANDLSFAQTTLRGSYEWIQSGAASDC